LTKDFIKIGRCSYYGDTRRMKQELLYTLKYPNLRAGKNLLLADRSEPTPTPKAPA